MASHLVDPPPARPNVTRDVKALRVGQSLKTDDIEIASARTLASKIKNDAKGTVADGMSFNVTKRTDGIYITRVS